MRWHVTHLLTTSTFQQKRPFGVFVTITHSKAATTKVHGIRSSDGDMRHYQVRGCLGHWNGASNPCEYSPYASVDSLLSQIVTLSCQALRHDNRTHPFTQAGVQVCADPGACVHVTVLQLPLYRIDVDSGTVVTTGKQYTHRYGRYPRPSSTHARGNVFAQRVSNVNVQHHPGCAGKESERERQAGVVLRIGIVWLRGERPNTGSQATIHCSSTERVCVTGRDGKMHARVYDRL